jgi:hypothetical protein
MSVALGDILRMKFVGVGGCPTAAVADEEEERDAVCVPPLIVDDHKETESVSVADHAVLVFSGFSPYAPLITETG